MVAIAVFDSGIGGTTVLDAVRERAPWADLIYVADHAFGPYGERSLEEVRARTELLAHYLDSAGVSIVVIACNSASAAALNHLRATLPEITFVGMEPAVKPAVAATKSGVVAVLATGATFQGELFRSLIGEHAGGVEVVEQACPGLAAAIESGSSVDAMLDEFIPPVVARGADVVVLGCTHYPHVRDDIARRLPSNVVVIDPSSAVAKRVVDVAHDIGADLHGSGLVEYWTTNGLERPSADYPWKSIDIDKTAVAAIRVNDATISCLTGDLTTMSVDAIVNAANVELEHGGGIALAIARAGGEAIDDESRDWIGTYGPLEPGVAALTSAGNMPSSYVIHVAGPIFQQGQDNEALLAAAVIAALDMAAEIEVHTVAMPAISAGIYGYPPADAALVIVESVASSLFEQDSTISSVRLVGFTDEMTMRFSQVIQQLQ
ncbi:MAG: glutamate racemase [Proteobacteria bacterium]|nr:glutamate racemase [Pseudomonadota bacterium]